MFNISPGLKIKDSLCVKNNSGGVNGFVPAPDSPSEVSTVPSDSKDWANKAVADGLETLITSPLTSL